MMEKTWQDVELAVETTRPLHVHLGLTPQKTRCLRGNGGLVLTTNPHIAFGYVSTDWDAINCQTTR